MTFAPTPNPLTKTGVFCAPTTPNIIATPPFGRLARRAGKTGQDAPRLPQTRRRSNADVMTPPRDSTIDLDGHAIRVWRKGAGPRVGFFAGWGGLPRWSPFLDELAKHREVIAPSLPGFPGGGRAHLDLDSHLDWIVAARRIFVAAGLEGADLIGASVGGALAAELAALWPASLRRLALVAPLGLYDAAEPPGDLFARRADEYPAFLCADPELWRAHVATPDGHDPVDWDIERARAAEAAARLLWPIASTRVERRAPLISQPTLLIRGELDQVVARAGLDAWAGLIPGGARTREIAGAGHLAELDQPAALARAILAFLD